MGFGDYHPPRQNWADPPLGRGEKGYLGVIAAVGIIGGLAAVVVSLVIGEWMCVAPGLCFGVLGIFVGAVILLAEFSRRR